MNSLSGPSLAAVDCEGWNDIFFVNTSVTDVERCLSAGADVNARVEGGRTPIELARRGTEVYWLLNDARYK